MRSEPCSTTCSSSGRNLFAPSLGAPGDVPKRGVDWKNRVVRELKSDAKSSQATGRRQLEKYVAELEDMTGQSWTGHLDTYKRFD
ncbi:hypothetical protein ACWC4C_24515 [Streptomyces olivaceoviridis]